MISNRYSYLSNSNKSGGKPPFLTLRSGTGHVFRLCLVIYENPES